MGIFNKRRLSPEELEEKSRQEKEWADRCYRAGERFGRKYNLRGKVERLNELANRYPKSFFGALLAVVVGSFILNLVVMRCQVNTGDLRDDIRVVTLDQDTSRRSLRDEVNALYYEMDGLNAQMERYLGLDTLTRSDSLQMGRILVRMKEINELIVGHEQAAQPSDETGEGGIDGMED